MSALHWVAVIGFTYLSITAVVPLSSPARADTETAGRLERDAQVLSNNGHYDEARTLREIAEALKNKDSVLSRQVQIDAGKRRSR
jgi:hypothetical protein